LKKYNSKKVKTDAAFVNSWSNTEWHGGHKNCAQCRNSADRKNCNFKGFFVIVKAAEPKHKHDYDSVSEWGGQQGARIE
jgi:hypothetical protein